MKCILIGRNCIIVAGNDRFNFLQGLITNDVMLLKKQQVIYACILTPQGKYFADIFIINCDDYFLIDIPQNLSAELIVKLNMYKLRSNVSISAVENIKVIAAEAILDGLDKKLTYFNDPRNKDLGFRYYIDKQDISDIDNLEDSDRIYDLKRIELLIPEGEKDLISNKSFPLEYELDRLGAISFTKGCYVGQEVVSRTKYRGVIRKKIYKIIADKDLLSGQEILVGGNKIGTLCSVVNNIGLALLYKEFYANFLDDKVVTDSGHHLLITEL